MTSEEYKELNKLTVSIYNKSIPLNARIIDFMHKLSSFMYYDRGAIEFFYRNDKGNYKKHSSIKINWNNSYVPVQKYDDYYCQYDDTLPILDQNSPIIFKSSDFFNQEKRKQSIYWNEYLKPNDCYFSIEGNLQIDSESGLKGGFSFFRGIDKKDFDNRDLDIMSFIQPHLSNVFEDFDNDFNSANVMFLLEEFDCVGIAILDEHYDVINDNTTFETMVSNNKYGPMLLNKAKMLCIDINRSNNISSKEYKFDNDPVFMQVSKIFHDKKGNQYCCIIYDLSYFFNKSLLKTKEKYALTKREFEIVQELIKGKSIDQISSTFFISVPTVKKDLASIYLKMDIKNQKQIFQKIGMQ